MQKRLSQLGIDIFSGAETTRVSPRFVLFQSDDLKSAQTGIDPLQKGAIVLPILTLLLFGAAIALSRGRRKTALHAGLGIAAGMLVILTAFNVGRSFYLDAVTSPTLPSNAAAAAYDQLLSFPRLAARTGFVLGIIIAIGAWLAGPTATATRLRSLTKDGKDRELATVGVAGWVARADWHPGHRGRDRRPGPGPLEPPEARHGAGRHDPGAPGHGRQRAPRLRPVPALRLLQNGRTTTDTQQTERR